MSKPMPLWSEFVIFQMVGIPYQKTPAAAACGIFHTAWFMQWIKRGKFNPDFFIKAGNLILVVETKGNEELRESSEENRKKNEYAVAHFDRVNEHLAQESSTTRYKFNFLTPKTSARISNICAKGVLQITGLSWM